MKSTLLALCLLVSCATSFAQVQKGDIEVFGAVGRLSMADLLLSLANRDEDMKSSVTPPIYMAGCRYYVSRKIALGVTLGQHSFAMSGHNRYNAYSYSEYFDGVFVCIEMKRLYLNRPSVQLYSTLAAGITYMKGKYTEVTDDKYYPPTTRNVSPWLPAFYWSPLGIHLGQGKMGVFAEVGLGTRGLYNGGLTYSIQGRPRRGFY